MRGLPRTTGQLGQLVEANVASRTSGDARALAGILFTQRMMDSPEPPEFFVDFWTLAYAAME